MLSYQRVGLHHYDFKSTKFRCISIYKSSSCIDIKTLITNLFATIEHLFGANDYKVRLIQEEACLALEQKSSRWVLWVNPILQASVSLFSAEALSIYCLSSVTSGGLCLPLCPGRWRLDGGRRLYKR